MRNQFYIATSKMNSSKMIIRNNEKAALFSHKHNTSNFQWKIYSDENDKDDDVIVATMNFNWNTNKRLKNVEITLTHHEEFEDLIMIVKKLIKRCETSDNVCNKIYKVYFDSQISLKVIHVMLSTLNQEKLQRI